MNIYADKDDKISKTPNYSHYLQKNINKTMFYKKTKSKEILKMFFRRQEGRYRETDRVTRYKLIKSGKHWLRASTSLFGLFKVLRGGVDTAQVTTEVVEDRVSTSLTGIDVLKGIVAAGAVVGGGVATHTQVHANEQLAVEKVVDGTDNLVNSDQVVLGTVNKDEEQQTSVSTSTRTPILPPA